MTRDSAAIERPTLHMQRVFDAPRSLVCAAWTEPEMSVRWIGLAQWPAISHVSDFRVGGNWSATLQSTEGKGTYDQSGIYLEIVPQERLVFTFKWDEGHEDGTPVDTQVTVVLSDNPGGATLLDFTHAALKSGASAKSHRHGWASTFDRLDQWLAERRS